MRPPAMTWAPVEARDARVLSFRDPDHMRLELVAIDDRPLD